MTHTLIGLAGFISVGKDSVAKALATSYAFQPHSLADPIRRLAEKIDPVVGWRNIECGMSLRFEPIRYTEVLSDVGGYRRAKDEVPEVRRFLQQLGTRVREELGEDVWVDALFRLIAANGESRVVIPDVRFDNEVDAIRDKGGEVWLVTREGYGRTSDHVTEELPETLVPDYTIVNDNSLCDLYSTIWYAMTRDPKPL